MQPSVEFCELFAQKTGNWVSRTAMCRYATEIRDRSKKKHGTAAKPRPKESKNEDWSIGKSSEISSQKTSVFLDETGILLGAARTHARSQPGTRVYSLKPFYPSALIHSHWRN